MADKASEFGGVSGRIAPLPHPLTNYEAARLLHRIDPLDESTTIEDMRVLEAIEEGRDGIANPDGFDGRPSL